MRTFLMEDVFECSFGTPYFCYQILLILENSAKDNRKLRGELQGGRLGPQSKLYLFLRTVVVHKLFINNVYKYSYLEKNA